MVRMGKLILCVSLLIALNGCISEGEFREQQVQLAAVQSRVTELFDRQDSISARVNTLDMQITSEAESRVRANQGMRAAIADERKSRIEMSERVSDTLAERDALLTQMRSVLRDVLNAELEVMISLVEGKRMLEDLKKRGQLTEEEIKASRVLAFEDTVWAARIESLRKQIESLGLGN